MKISIILLGLFCSCSIAYASLSQEEQKRYLELQSRIYSPNSSTQDVLWAHDQLRAFERNNLWSLPQSRQDEIRKADAERAKVIGIMNKLANS